MQAAEILTALREAGATARFNRDKLLVEPGNKVPLELVPEIRRTKSEIMQLIAHTTVEEKLTPDAKRTLLRLRAGSRWLTAAHLAWASEETDAPSDEKFSTALAAWDLLERKLRNEFGYEGCVYGPGQHCPENAPVMCGCSPCEAATFVI